MKMRLLVGVATTAALLLAGGWLMGEDKKPDDPSPKLKGMLPAHYKKLGLSDAQVQSIYKIQASYKDKIDALQQQLDDLKKTEHTEIEGVLTDAQKTALKALQTGEPTTDPPVPPKDKPTTTDKATPPDKDKPAPTTTPVKDKAPPATDK